MLSISKHVELWVLPRRRIFRQRFSGLWDHIQLLVETYIKRIPRYGLNPMRAKPKDPGFHNLLFLRLEVTSLCNANCTFCVYQFNNRPRIAMDTDIYEKAVTEFTNLGGGRLDFSPIVGDALIDRDLEKKIAFAKRDPRITEVSFYTNGILLTRERFDSLVEAGMDHVVISMSSFDREEYELLYRGGKYQTVLKNLYAISESPYFNKIKPHITVKTGKPDCGTQPDFIEMRRRGFIIWVQREIDSWDDQISQSDLPDTMSISSMSDSQRNQGPCIQLASIAVRADGSMTYCGCRDDRPTSDLCIGNIRDQGLTDDAEDPNGVLARVTRQFMNDDPDDLPDVCRNCTMYQPFGPEYPKYKAKPRFN